MRIHPFKSKGKYSRDIHILSNISIKYDTPNKSHNGVVKFRRYYLGKSRLFYIHLRGIPPHPIYVSGHKTNADKCGNKMNIRFIPTLWDSVTMLAGRAKGSCVRVLRWWSGAAILLKLKVECPTYSLFKIDLWASGYMFILLQYFLFKPHL